MSTIVLKSPSGTVNLIPEDIAGTHNVTIPSAGVVSPASLRTELNASGTAPIYACRAWVNFNGTGTVAIRASGNVSSITDNGTGDYTANLISAMPSNLYSVSGMVAYDNSVATNGRYLSIATLETTSFRFTTTYTYNNVQDCERIAIQLIG